MIERADAADMAEHHDAADPIDKAEAADPIEPKLATDPTDPIERTLPCEPMHSTESRDAKDHRELLISPRSWPCHLRRPISPGVRPPCSLSALG